MVDFAQQDGRIAYTAVGSQTSFPYDFLINEQEEIIVYVNGSPVTPASVSDIGDENGGNVVLLESDVNDGDSVLIVRDLIVQRLTNFIQNGDLTHEALNLEFDNLGRLIAQNLINSALALKFPSSEAIPTAELLNAAGRSNKVLGFDSDGNITYLSSAIPVTGSAHETGNVASMRALTGLTSGDTVRTLEHMSGFGGGRNYNVVLTATVTVDNVNIIQSIADTTLSFSPIEATGPFTAAQFGIVGSGDETSRIEILFNTAKAAKKGVWFENGTYTYNPTTTFDLSGIPYIDGDDAILNTEAAASTLIFSVQGVRSAALASGISISAGEDISTTITTANLDVGNTFVIASIESLPNTERPEYYKSGMFVVYANNGAGSISVQPSIPYDFTSSAYIYRLDLQKMVLGRGITFQGKTSAGQECFEVFAVDADVYSTFIGYNGDAFRYVTSRGNFKGKCRGLEGNAGSGVDIDDASDVNVNADIFGAFHAVDAGGGTQYWDGSFAGGSSSDNMALSCRMVVSGGFYSSKSTLNGTINAHGNTDKAVVGDCQINGSTLNLSARTVDINNVSIEGEQDILLRWGADNNSTDWCDVNITDVRIKRYKQLPGNFGIVEFQTDARARDINIDGVWVEGDYSGNDETETPILLLGQCRRLSLKNAYPNHLSNVRAMYARLFANTVYEFYNVRAADGNRIEFDAQQDNVNLVLDKVSVRDAGSTSGISLMAETGINYNHVDVIDCEGVNNQVHGLDATRVSTLRVKGGDFSENNQSGGRGINASEVETLRISHADLTNTGRAFQQTDFGSGSTASVVACDVSGAAGDMDGALGTGCTWEARSANTGDSKDYFRQDDGNLYFYDQSLSTWTAV